MRTKRADSPTKGRIIEAGETLMLSKGYRATSVDDICETAAVTKGSFFHYFASKEVLAKILIGQFAERQAAAFFAPIEGIPDPVDRVLAVIDNMISMCQNATSAAGCLVGTIAQEVSDTNPELRGLCAECFGGLSGKLADLLEEAREAVSPAPDFDARELADYFIALGQGSLLLVKTTGNREIFLRNLRHFRTHLTQLLGRKGC